MNRNEIRYRVTAALLQVGGPLTLSELAAESKVGKKSLRRVLEELVAKGQVVAGKLRADKPAPQYCWWARWEREAALRRAGAKQRLREAVGRFETAKGRPAIDSETVLTFHNHIVDEYEPPKDKRFLVFFQCSVRRPFSSSPSHASMRRAISVATGADPGKDFDRCPVHVVVLASYVGPVPYELEDMYPANVRSGGVKHMNPERYARMKPILAERMAEYIIAHRDSYDRIATFTESRYGEVMEEAGKLAKVDFPVLPVPDGPTVTRMGKSRPRKYWEKYWIQLYLEIVSWLDPAQRKQAAARLKEMDVEYEGASTRGSRKGAPGNVDKS